ncbi:hypothetical protein [Flavobacterium sp.]|jgi:hypothetical protein|uniref:hypothetical protein n=1 Tax=Flavobacterium sp. TaxID=239 RepID=UPI0022BB8222|nr:hypothetical protein [Flavobacterium sp.]MCZ8145302.1 hypothetical protein [Flavobacterium sp.]MCZ8368152.1 hypothetical protein [Flavobacterium sp.]
MENNSSIKKEVILILVGAIISALTAFITSSISESRQDKKENTQKRLEFNDQISKDLGKRLYFTFQLYKLKRDKKPDSIALNEYRKSREEWNIKIYSYQSLLKHYYSNEVKEEFMNTIYEPLVKLGQKAEYSTYDKNFHNQWTELQKENIEFVTKIYNLTEN